MKNWNEKMSKQSRLPMAMALLCLVQFFPNSGFAANGDSSLGPTPGTTFSASIREEFTSIYRFPYGTDSMLRTRRELSDIGFNVFTLSIRLSVEGEEDSQVYPPQYKSKRSDVETLIAAVQQGRGQVALRPVIGKQVGMDAITRLPGLRPKNPELFFTTYLQALSAYVSIAEKRDIAEIILGVGLDNLWSARFSKQWHEFIIELRRRAGEQTRFSFELTSENSIEAFQTWQLQDPIGFKAVMDLVERIRIVSAPIENTPGKGDWNVDKTRDRLTRRLRTLADLFPNKYLTIASISAPACREYSMLEDEIQCAENFTIDKQYQANAFSAWFAALEQQPADLRARVAELDFLAATTNIEPEKINKSQARFFLFNEIARKMFATNLKKILDAPAFSWGGSLQRFVEERSSLLSPSRLFSSTQPGKKLACIFFEEGSAQDYVGPIHARMLENLLGAFPAWKPLRFNISTYRKGDIDVCEAAFYLGSNFNVITPPEFMRDAAIFSTTKHLVWMNYKFGDFAAVYDKFAREVNQQPLAFTSTVIEQPIDNPAPDIPDPGFFRYFDYKGETFEKKSGWDPITNRFLSSPELNLIQARNHARVQVLAKARHSRQTQRETPYAVRQMQGKGGIWYIADSPFSFVHYEDRYLIFCDLLWDMLQEKAPSGPLGALVRIEDVNPTQNQADLVWVIDYLSSQKVPFSLAVIPYYSSVFGSGERGPPTWKPVWQYPEFVGTLRYAAARGASMVMHGMAHQAGDLISGYDGTSGADYEFWHYPENKPLPFDSSDYVLDRLEKAEAVFNRLNLKPMAWEVPHYAASALDSLIFGKLFEWNYHRSLYFKGEIKNDVSLDPKLRMFNCKDKACRKERADKLRQLQLDVDYNSFGGQILPYRVFKDSYGQAIIPETLGMVDYMFYNDNTWRPVGSPETVLRYAKKLRAVRGAFASFFWHPDVMNPKLDYYVRHPGHFDTQGGKHTLIKIIEGLKALGYSFKSIGDCELFPRAECAKR